MGLSALGISQLATMYYLVPVTATKSGTAYNPTSDAVAFAFMPAATQVPAAGDWVAGSWDTNTSSVLFPYNAKVLVGPAGTAALGIGTYVAYLRITNSPEVPVLIAGYLEVS